ncbi:MAG: GNAT family N-acetyltransferase [Candidatus Acidiferrum sp.]
MARANPRTAIIAAISAGRDKKRLKVSAQRLETERVILLPWEAVDWLNFKPLATDPLVMKYISDGTPWPDSKIKGFVKRQRRHFAELGYCLWKLSVKDKPGIAGFCGLQPLDDLPGVEIGWWLAPANWGKGIATEAARKVLMDGFGRCGLNRIVAVAQEENIASTRVMEKLGMRYEGVVSHRGREVVLYSIEK